MSVRFKAQDSIHDADLCLRGLNLLGHAQMIELEIGSQCGGYGRCGKDIVILEEKDQKQVNPPTDIEKVHLTEAELRAGMRLACQCFPDSDGLDITPALKST